MPSEAAASSGLGAGRAQLVTAPVTSTTLVSTTPESSGGVPHPHVVLEANVCLSDVKLEPSLHAVAHLRTLAICPAKVDYGIVGVDSELVPVNAAFQTVLLFQLCLIY